MILQSGSAFTRALMLPHMVLLSLLISQVLNLLLLKEGIYPLCYNAPGIICFVSTVKGVAFCGYYLVCLRSCLILTVNKIKYLSMWPLSWCDFFFFSVSCKKKKARWTEVIDFSTCQERCDWWGVIMKYREQGAYILKAKSIAWNQ